MTASLAFSLNLNLNLSPSSSFKKKKNSVPLQLPRGLLPPLPRAPLPPLRGAQGLLLHFQRLPFARPGGLGRAADAAQGRRPRRTPARRAARDHGNGGLAEAPAAVEAPDRVRGRDFQWFIVGARRRKPRKRRCRGGGGGGRSRLAAGSKGLLFPSHPPPLRLPRRPGRRRRSLDRRERVGDPSLDEEGGGRFELVFFF